MPSRNIVQITPEIEKKFAEEYLIDLDPFSAALRVGLRNGNKGFDLLAKPRVSYLIRLNRDRRASRTEITADYVLRTWLAVATADPNELVQLRRVNCRYCHGINHEYQWTPAEYDKALLDHAKLVAKANKAGIDPPPAPNDTGGTNFDQWADPTDDCPECNGAGVERPYFCDTRNLSPAARLLYAGVEQGANGAVKLKMRDQEAALLNVAKHLGMHIDRKEVSGPNGEPLTIEVKVVKPSVEIEGDVVEV